MKEKKLTLGEKVFVAMAVVVGIFCLGTKVLSSTCEGGQSFYGSYWAFTFSDFGAELDSGKAILGFPNTGNEYDTISLLPDTAGIDSNTIRNDSLLLDSIGVHSLKVLYYSRGATTVDSSICTWTNTLATRPIFLDAPTAANTCRLFGYLQDGGGNPIVGAEVWAIRVGSGTGIDTSSSTVIVGAIPVYDSDGTDTTGLFQIQLRKTTSFADTTKGFYDVKATFSGSDIFFVKKLYIPDQDSVNIGDTILSRSD